MTPPSNAVRKAAFGLDAVEGKRAQISSAAYRQPIPLFLAARDTSTEADDVDAGPVSHSPLPPSARFVNDTDDSTEIDILSSRPLPKGWVRPSAAAINRAKGMVAALSLRNDFAEPNVTTSPMGDVVLEWWHDARKITVYASSDAYEILRVWGPDLDTEMDDTCRELDQAYGWLRSG